MPATTLMNFRVTPEERTAIQERATAQGVSASELIREALAEKIRATEVPEIFPGTYAALDNLTIRASDATKKETPTQGGTK